MTHGRDSDEPLGRPFITPRSTKDSPHATRMGIRFTLMGSGVSPKFKHTNAYKTCCKWCKWSFNLAGSVGSWWCNICIDCRKSMDHIVHATAGTCYPAPTACRCQSPIHLQLNNVALKITHPPFYYWQWHVFQMIQAVTGRCLMGFSERWVFLWCMQL